jgi:hypothetical protein
VNTPNDANCPDDGLFCNGTEFCDPAADCSSTGDPCAAGEVCDESTDTCIAEPVDLDISKFQVSKSAKVGEEIKRIQLTVENPNGGGNAGRIATLTGYLNGVLVYNEDRFVFDLAGNGKSRFAFPTFEPGEAGTIEWTVTIFDDDPDDDTATASTNVR